MEIKLGQIKDIVNRGRKIFSVCKCCKCVNFYLNRECFKCGHDEFITDNDLIKKEIEDTFQFYEEQGLKEEEIKDIVIRIA